METNHMSIDPSAETDRIERKGDKVTYHETKLMIKRELENFNSKLETKNGFWTKLFFVLIPILLAFNVFLNNLDKKVDRNAASIRIIEKAQNEIIVDLRKQLREINGRLYSIEIILARKGIDVEGSQ